MLDIKIFEDGGRTVIVTEGLPHDMIKKIVSEITGSSLTLLTPIEAEPVTVSTEATQIIQTIDNPRFTEGPYVDKTPEEIINDPDAFNWLIESLKNNNIKNDLLKEKCYSCIKIYLADKFRDADPETYPDKLTERQVTIFLNRYCYAFPRNILEDIANQCKFNDIEQLKNSNDVDSKKNIIKQLLLYMHS